ncbi:MAG: aminopeptidase P N-terminal domain-containing protein, partial [Haemophilus parainfluenzae]|nr:aminopeptidase P N-terminal domain-containing protein [Haemophilus parainfluenzae]
MDLAYMAALPQEEFTERRQKVFAQMQPNSALLLFSEIEKRRNNDCDFPFRQDSYFWYLTGFNEPNAALLLIKTEEAEKAVVFLRPRDPLLETWNGRRLGVERAPQKLNVDEAYSIDDFKTEFPKLTEKLTAFYHVADRHPWGDKLLAESAVKFYAVFDWQPMLSEMRLIKSSNEIRLM